MTHELGPLPEPSIKGRSGSMNRRDYYTADQMRSYAAAEVARAVEAEREKNAQALAFVRGYLADYASEDGMYDAKHYAKLAHEAIRALT